jgi:hypothetical protein
MKKLIAVQWWAGRGHTQQAKWQPQKSRKKNIEYNKRQKSTL